MTNYLDQWFMLRTLKNTIDYELEFALQNDGSYPIQLNEFYVLYFLSADEVKASRLQELGQKVGLSASAMSRMIAKMESRSCGVIQRSICEDDKRGVHITLTAYGEELLSEALGIVEGVLEKHAVKFKNLE